MTTEEIDMMIERAADMVQKLENLKRELDRLDQLLSGVQRVESEEVK